MSDTQWTHSGVTITMNAGTAKFEATVGIERLTSTSLAGIKKQIDKRKKSGFEPFDCLLYAVNTVEKKKIVGIRNARKTRYGHNREKQLFTTDLTGTPLYNDRTRVTMDTPAARAAIKAWQEHEKIGKRVRDRHDEIGRVLLERIPSITVEEYLKEKN